jgi:ubiquinone/menaquinone biosynthesis C-methylase UbiE
VHSVAEQSKTGAAWVTETERVRRIWDQVAPKFDRQIRFWERVMFHGGRQWVCSRASGEVLEVAVGTGRNLTFYPAGVRPTGIDLSEQMLQIARARADSLDRPVDLCLADAQALPLPDSSFDTVVCTLALCSIPDDRRAVAEIARVLRPGGRVLLLEHVRSPRRAVRAFQHVVDLLTVRLEGDHQLREPLDHLRVHGFDIETLERSKWGMVERVSARKPAAGP